MVDENLGLTTTCNRLKDPGRKEAHVVELQRLREEMDAAVLRAYGWGDVAVPSFCPADEEEKKRVEAFENDVIDWLFMLNAMRAEEERVRGAKVEGKQKGKERRECRRRRGRGTAGWRGSGTRASGRRRDTVARVPSRSRRRRRTAND